MKSRSKLLVPPALKSDLPTGAYVYSVPLKGAVVPPREPTPDEIERRQRGNEAFRSGIWEQWFDEVPPELETFFHVHGYARPLRQAAIGPLRRLYRPDVCRRMLKNPRDREIIAGLFNSLPPSWIFPLLDLGADLQGAEPWSDKKLLGDLCSHEGFATACNEVEVWRRLRQIDPFPEREPLGPDGRRPDFAARVFGWRHVIEVKTLRASAGEKLAEWLRQQMIMACHEMQRPNRYVQVQATSLVRELLNSVAGRNRIQAEAPRMIARLANKAHRVADRGLPVGRNRATDWFNISIAEDLSYPDGVVATGVWPGAADDRRAVRIATLVEGAMEQIPQSSNGIVFVSVGTAVAPDIVAKELYRRATDQPVLFSPLRLVLLKWWQRTSPFRSESTGATIPLRGPLAPSEIRIARVLI